MRSGTDGEGEEDAGAEEDYEADGEDSYDEDGDDEGTEDMIVMMTMRRTGRMI